MNRRAAATAKPKTPPKREAQAPSAPAAAKVAAALGEPEGTHRLSRANGASARTPQDAALPSLFRHGSSDLAVDAQGVVRTLARKDPALGRAMKLIGPFAMRCSSMHSTFEALATSIAYQQLTGKAAATILGRVVALFAPRPFPRPQDVIAASHEKLRGAGLSRAKALSLRDLAAKTIEGVVPDVAALAALPEDEIIERLTQVRGIGRWTVEMLLMFRLGRPDVLPATDYGVRKGFARLLGSETMPSPKELLAHGERWRPFRTVASWYLWRVTELPDEVVLRRGNPQGSSKG
jgi:3-methyladenine DNA glycosylase/8-oxoguanine DNA glycosylase